MQYKVLQQRSLTNAILVFGCIAQSRNMTDKNVTARHDVGLYKHVPRGGIEVGVTVTSAHSPNVT